MEFRKRTLACGQLLTHLEGILRMLYPEDKDIREIALTALEKAATESFESYKETYDEYKVHIFKLSKFTCDELADTIKKYYKPDYTSLFETVKTPVKPATQSGGCYVATAVYGSYDCPQVWTLRRFRDYTLAETWYGRAFIRTYYAISPTLVKWFGHTEWFKKMWKGKLDRMVANLNAEGVEDTPYEDRIW